MRRRILVTILLVTTFADIAFLVPAAIAVRSGIQRSDLLALQREAASRRSASSSHPIARSTTC